MLRQLILGIMVFVCATVVCAQNSKDKVKPAPKTPAAIKLGKVTLSGSLRVRAEHWDWFETPGFQDRYTFGAAILRLGLSQQLKRLDWQVEGEFPVLVDLPTRAVAPAPAGQLGLGANYFAANGKQDGSAFLKQAYLRFKNGNRKDSLRLGRFEFIDGAETIPKNATLAALKRDRIAHRLLGNFGFSHVGRSFDGAQYVRDFKAGNVTLLAARPTEGVFQLRGWRELNVDVFYGAFTRALSGKKVQSEFRALGLFYQDNRHVLKTDNRTTTIRQTDLQNIRIMTVGGHYLAAIQTSHGTFDALVWGVGQFGAWGNLSQRSAAVAAELGFQPNLKLNPWLRSGYFRSTGDSNQNDGIHGTFFQVLPTPRIYARTPFYNLMNIEDVFAQLILKPTSTLNLRADVRHLRLSNANDLWYVGGGAFQQTTFGYTGRPSNSGRSLGTVVDVSLDYQLGPRTTLTFYGATVRGGNVEAAIYKSGGPNPYARFFYAELVQRF